MTDEHRTDSLGCYDSPWARTPCLDRLASEGVVFESAATPSPVCVPARVSLLSGMLPHQTGVLSNAYSDTTWRPLTDIFHEHGYQSASFGKQHYLRSDAFETSGNHVLSEAVHYFGYEKGRSHEDYSGVRYPREDRQWVFAGRFPEDPARAAEAEVVESSWEWLNQRDPSRPFFLRVSFNGPHTPVVAPGPFDDMLDADAISVPGASAPIPDDAPRWVREFLRDAQGSHRLTEAELRRARQCYYGLVSFLDSQFGRIVDRMETAGLLEDTIVAFVSDHGAHLGDHGMMQKQTFYEPVVTVPYFYWAPGRIAAGARARRPVETLSLMPTLLDLAGLPVPDYCRDLSLASALGTGEEPPERPVISEISQGTWGYRPEDRLVMVRRGEWKLVLFYDGPATDPMSERADASLYNLDADPLELTNLIRAPEHSDLIASLIADIAARD